MYGFRKFDSDGIFGTVGAPLTPDILRRWGFALASLIPPGGKFLFSSPFSGKENALSNAFIEGARSAEAAVVLVGPLPRPLIYYASIRTKADACVIITFPYYKESCCGFHWRIGEKAPNAKQVALLQQAAISSNPPNSRSSQPENTSAAVSSLEPRALDVSYDYVAWLQDTWFDSPSQSAHVVLDPKYGPWAGRARRYLQAVFPRLLFSAINDTPDPILAAEREIEVVAHRSNDDLSPLGLEVDKTRADLGVAFGPEGGEVFLVDGDGMRFSVDELNWFMLQTFGKSLEGETFLHDPRCCSVVVETAKKFGAKTKEIPSGYENIQNRMLEFDAPLGVDSTGKHFFRAINGHNDALFSVCWILDFLAHSGKQLKSYRDYIPQMSITPNLILPWTKDRSEIEPFLDSFSDHWKEASVSHIEGRKIMLSNGWIFLGESFQTEHPSLVFRCESDNAAHLDVLMRKTCAVLDQLDGRGASLWKSWE